MTSKLELFNTNSLPFGDLSNDAITPFNKDDKMWNSVTHYLYANLLTRDIQDIYCINSIT